MTTDTKAVGRWEPADSWTQLLESTDGPYILFTDHERVVGELEEKWRLACSEANDYGDQRDQAIKDRDAALDSLDANLVMHKLLKIDTGNLVDHPLYLALDGLYFRGWTDLHQKQKDDPRGCNEWQAVLDLVRSALAEENAETEALRDALILARSELAGLPHSLGYSFTHLPKIDAALEKGNV